MCYKNLCFKYSSQSELHLFGRMAFLSRIQKTQKMFFLTARHTTTFRFTEACALDTQDVVPDSMCRKKALFVEVLCKIHTNSF